MTDNDLETITAALNNRKEMLIALNTTIQPANLIDDLVTQRIAEVDDALVCINQLADITVDMNALKGVLRGEGTDINNADLMDYLIENSSHIAAKDRTPVNIVTLARKRANDIRSALGIDVKVHK